MLCANQAMIRAGLAFVGDEPPVIVDWLPWNHTFGGNHNFGLVLHNGGTLYIDDGKPMPGAIEATVRNLREIAPTMYFNVPKGYEVLLPHLRADAALREKIFQPPQGAVLRRRRASRSTSATSCRSMASTTCGERIIFLTGLGSTETAPFALACSWDSATPAISACRRPGVELKLVPTKASSKRG